MKVQITVDDVVWKKAKAKAALEGQTLGELVGEALGKAVNAISEHTQDVRVVTKTVSEQTKSILETVPVVGQPVECKHEWIVRNGKSECMYCRERPKK